MNEDLNGKQLSRDGSAELPSQTLDAKQLFEFSVEGPCYGCGKKLRGLVIPFHKQSDLNGFGLKDIVGYRCSSCGSMYCKGCRRRVLNFHWSSGFEKSICKKCNISMSRPAVVISDEAFEVIKNKPTFNPSDLRDPNGLHKMEGRKFKCSACGETIYEEDRVCPKCGAKFVKKLRKWVFWLILLALFVFFHSGGKKLLTNLAEQYERNQRAKQEEKSDWEIAVKGDKLHSYEDFVRSWPNSKHSSQAINKIDELTWKEAMINNTLSGYISYIDKHSTGKFVSMAFQKIKEIAVKSSQTEEILVETLRHWHTAKVASEILEDFGWVPRSIDQTIHFGVARRDGRMLREMWSQSKQVLLDDVKSSEYVHIENALYAFIGLGKEEIIAELIKMLEERGNKTTAEAFLNCGNSKLRKRAEEWAERNGYKISVGSGAHPVSWGTW